jgi:hypothetical protein
MDESGVDKKKTPYEVRGGIAIHSKQLRSFNNDMMISEKQIFGCFLSEYKTELKGSKLLQKNRFKCSEQLQNLSDEERRKNCLRFLDSSLKKRLPTKIDFTAFGQASIKMVDTIFALLFKYDAKIFACVANIDEKKPENFEYEHYLRKDHALLMERFYRFLQEQNDDGFLIMDQCEKKFDKKFKKQLHNYFKKTEIGKKQSEFIIPEPFFIESDINYFIQIADLIIYIINHGYRKAPFMNKPARKEIKDKYEEKIRSLEFFTTDKIKRDGKTIDGSIYGIKLVKDIYKKKR